MSQENTLNKLLDYTSVELACQKLTGMGVFRCEVVGTLNLITLG